MRRSKHEWESLRPHLEKLVAEGLSTATIAHRTGVSYVHMLNKLKELGLTPNRRRKSTSDARIPAGYEKALEPIDIDEALDELDYLREY